MGFLRKNKTRLVNIKAAQSAVFLLLIVGFFVFVKVDLVDAKDFNFGVTGDRIFLNGNVGVGTTNPQVPLSVVSSGDNWGLFIGPNAGSTTGQRLKLGYFGTSNYSAIQSIQDGVAATNLVLQKDGGNVGIGTTNPGTKLDIASGILSIGSLNISNGQQSSLKIYSYDNVAQQVGALAADYADTLRTIHLSGSANTQQIKIDSSANASADIILMTAASGNVGVGTTNPLEKLNVSVADNAYGMRIVSNAADNTFNGIRFSYDAGVNTNDYYIGKIEAWKRPGGGGDLILNAASASNAYNSNQLVLSKGGNVGINTTNPGTKLDVSGALRATAITDTALGAGCLCSDASGNVYVCSCAVANSWSANGTSIYYNGGNVGIGTASPGAKLDVQGGNINTSGSLTATSGIFNGNVAINASNNILNFNGGGGTDSYVRFADTEIGGQITGLAYLQWQRDNNQGRRFSVNVSSSAGVTNQALTILENGNVGIGTTGPGAKLDVNGRIQTNTDIITPAVYGSALVVGDSAGGSPRFQFSNTSITTQGTGNVSLMSGNVGINTTAPGVKLDVSGGLRATAITDSALGAGIVMSDASGNLSTGGSVAAASGWTVSGTTVYKTDTNGNVGIGNTTPWQKLAVSGEIIANEGTWGTGGYSFIGDGGYDTGMFSPSDGAIDFYNNTIHSLNINASGQSAFYQNTYFPGSGIWNTSGNVGIGTTGPVTPLEINRPSGNDTDIRMWQVGVASSYIGHKASDSNLYVTNAYDGNAIGAANRSITLDRYGNVGIGTTNPGGALEISRTGSTPILKMYNNRNADSQTIENRILFGGYGSGGWSTPDGAGIDFHVNYPAEGANAQLRFWAYPLSTGSTPSMTINGANVGIAKTNPGVKLDVSGALSATAITDTALGAGIVVSDAQGNLSSGGTVGNADTVDGYHMNQNVLTTSAPTFTGISLSGNGGAISGIMADSDFWKIFGDGSSNNGVLHIQSGDDGTEPIYLQQMGAVRLAIDASGNVGIGTTAPSTGYKLDVRGNLFLSQSGANLRINLDQSGLRGWYIDNTTSGNLTFTSGDGGGNVGIGLTNPGYKLDVSGVTNINAGSLGRSGLAGVMITGSLDHLDPLLKVSEANATGCAGCQRYGQKISVTGVAAGSTNIGLYVTAANGGTNYAAIFDQGTVGIGTTAPGVKLDVNGALRATAITDSALGTGIVMSDASGNLSTGGSVAAASGWTVSGTTVYKTDTNGNVGIGTTAPGGKFEISAGQGANSGAPATAGSVSTAISRLASNNGNGEVLDSGMNVGPSYGWLQATNRGNLGINYNLALQPNGGNVGIGTTNPQRALDLGATGKSITFGNDVTQNAERGIYWHSGSVYGIYQTGGAWSSPNYQQLKLSWDTGIIIDGGSAYGKSGLILQPSGGNVGIGTTAPRNKLQVISDSSSNGLQFDTPYYNTIDYYGTRIYKTDNGSGIPLYVDTQSGGTWRNTLIIGNNDDNNNPALRVYGRTFLATDAGNVGIGNTNPGVKLDVSGAMRATAITDSALGAGIVMSDASGNLSTSGTITGIGGLSVNNGIAINRAPYADQNTLNIDLKSSVANGTGVDGINFRSGGNDPSDGAQIYYLSDRNGTAGAESSQLVIANQNDSPGDGILLKGADIIVNAGKTHDGSAPDPAIRFQVTDSDKMVIGAGGNVGIGTAAPGSLLQVGNGLKLMSDGTMNWGGSAADYGRLTWDTGKAIIQSQSGKDLSFGASGTWDQLVIKPGGNVGIGTTAPAGKLDVEGGNVRFGSLAGTYSTGYGEVDVRSNPYHVDPLFNVTAIGGSGCGGCLRNAIRAQVTDAAPSSNNTALWLDASGGSSNFAVYSNSGVNYFADNVGIGTTAPSTGYKLDVRGNLFLSQSGANLRINLDQSGLRGWYIDNTTSGNLTFTSGDGGGNVGIGTTGPANKLQVIGDIGATGFVYNSSDVSLKKNIETIQDPLGKIMKLRGVTFNWKKDNTPAVGLIAQEVETVYPELVTGKEGNKEVAYSNLVAPLIEAVKAQQKEIEDLKAQQTKLMNSLAQNSTQLKASQNSINTLSTRLKTLEAKSKKK